MSLKCRPHMEPSGVPRIRPPMPPCQKRLRLPVMTVNGTEPDAKGNVVVDTPDLSELEGRVDELDNAVSEESRRAVGAEEELGGSIAAEESRAKAAEQGLRDDVSSAQTAIEDRYTKRETDEKIAAATPSDYDAVKGRVAAVEAKVPAQASAQNQLADKAFVNSSIATNTAFYISDGGRPFQSLADLESYEGALTNNDYAFVVGRDAAGNTTYTRYKWNEATEAWGEEYVLNNSSFTAEQWTAISSGITSGLVAKLGALPTAEALASALAGMQARLVVQAGYAWRFSTESQGAGIEAFMEDADGYSVTYETVDTTRRYSVVGYDTDLYLVQDTFVIGSPSSVHFFVYNASGTELYGRVSASYESVSEDVPPEVDPDPARGSGRLTTSGGVWSMIWGALAALPAGFSSLYDWVVNQLAGKAPLASPAFTGTPTAQTPDTGDDSTKVATTEFVQDALPYAIATVSSGDALANRTVNTKTVNAATYAPSLPAETSGMSCDFYLAVTSDTAGAVSAPSGKTLLNAKGDTADMSYEANKTTVFRFTQTADNTYVVTGGANGGGSAPSGDIPQIVVASGYDTLDYVQRGLVVHLDGIENAGRGLAHDANATSWKNLVKYATGSAAALAGITNDIELPTDATWADNGMNVTRAYGKTITIPQYASDNPIYTAFVSAEITIEIVFDKTADTPNSGQGNRNKMCVLLMYGRDSSWIGTFTKADDSADYVGFSANNNGNSAAISSAVSLQKTGAHTPSYGKHSLVCRQSGANWSVVWDGIDTAYGTATVSDSPPSNHGISFNKGYYQDHGLEGRVYAIRVYNRRLTDAEIALNRTIDIARFGLEE